MITLIIVLISLYVVILGIYYLRNKEKMKKWKLPVKIFFYYGFILCSIIIIWEIVATAIKYIKT
jgi:hypothetical protein